MSQKLKRSIRIMYHQRENICNEIRIIQKGERRKSRMKKYSCWHKNFTRMFQG